MQENMDEPLPELPAVLVPVPVPEGKDWALDQSEQESKVLMDTTNSRHWR